MRQAEIYRKEILAGVLTEDGGEYRFCYDEAYLAGEDAQPVSLTLPLQTEAFVSPVLFPFFDGLIPEGWLLDVALRNNDMHLKNFSLYRPSEGYQLTPAYDLLNVAIANPKDKEELALPLSGRKTKLRLDDFLTAAKLVGLEENVVLRLIEGLRRALPKWQTLIRSSFLSADMKKTYEELILSRLNRLQKPGFRQADF